MNASSPTTLRFASALALACFLAPAAAVAHPHVFIDIVETIRLDEGGIVGVDQEWRLAGAFGVDAQSRYDADQDGAFDEAEQARIYDTTFLPLWMENSFFRLFKDGVEYTAPSVRDFTAEIYSGEVRFSFSVPCGIRSGGAPVEVEMITYDSSTYISFDLYDCRVAGRTASEYSLEFVPDPDIISHGLDRCGTRVRFIAAPSNAAPLGAAAAGAGAPDGLVPMTGAGPAAPVNPFTGLPATSP